MIAFSNKIFSSILWGHIQNNLHRIASKPSFLLCLNKWTCALLYYTLDKSVMIWKYVFSRFDWIHLKYKVPLWFDRNENKRRKYYLYYELSIPFSFYECLDNRKWWPTLRLLWLLSFLTSVWLSAKTSRSIYLMPWIDHENEGTKHHLLFAFFYYICALFIFDFQSFYKFSPLQYLIKWMLCFFFVDVNVIKLKICSTLGL